MTLSQFSYQTPNEFDTSFLVVCESLVHCTTSGQVYIVNLKNHLSQCNSHTLCKITLDILCNARKVLIQSIIVGLFTSSLAKSLYKEPLFDEFIYNSLLFLSKNMIIKSKFIFTNSLIFPRQILSSFFFTNTIKSFCGFMLTKSYFFSANSLNCDNFSLLLSV